MKDELHGWGIETGQGDLLSYWEYTRVQAIKKFIEDAEGTAFSTFHDSRMREWRKWYRWGYRSVRVVLKRRDS
jgi:hypothetical protein